MPFRAFAFQVTWRAVALALSLLTAAYLLLKLEFLFLPVLLADLAVLQVYELTRYVRRAYTEVGLGLEALRNQDFSHRALSPGMLKAFPELGDQLQRLQEHFLQLEAGRRARIHLLENVMDGLEAGLLLLAEDGTVLLQNPALLRLLSVPAPARFAELAERFPALSTALEQAAEERRVWLSLPGAAGPRRLVLQRRPLVLSGRSCTLVTLFDLSQELEENAQQNYIDLMSVLAHEILNSLTPLTSLGASAAQLLETYAPTAQPAPPPALAQALGAIQQRGESLRGFVSRYRRLAEVPAPARRRLPVAELAQRLSAFLRHEMPYLETTCLPPDLTLYADDQLLEQALLNLLINAGEAVRQVPEPHIALTLWQPWPGTIWLEVRDNGPGIPPDLLEKVCLPFFSTKPGGGGLGLALTRQIAWAHGGTLELHSPPSPNRGTLARICLPA